MSQPNLPVGLDMIMSLFSLLIILFFSYSSLLFFSLPPNFLHSGFSHRLRHFWTCGLFQVIFTQRFRKIITFYPIVVTTNIAIPCSLFILKGSKYPFTRKPKLILINSKRDSEREPRQFAFWKPPCTTRTKLCELFKYCMPALLEIC